MKVNTLLHVHTIAFSECNYFGFLKIQACLRWFEDERFNISKEADIQDFFLKEHRMQEIEVSLINDENEYFTMPVIENKIRCYEKISFGKTVNIHTWLEKPIGSYCTFHHYVTSTDNKNILISCQTKVVLLGEKTGLRINMPKILEERIINYINSINSNNQIEVEYGS